MSLLLNKVLILVLLIVLPLKCLLSQEKTNNPVPSKTDSLRKAFATKAIKLDSSQKQLLLTLPEPDKSKLNIAGLEYRVPFSKLFKYDTSPNNPENRCYEITKPLTKKYTFLFNFMSSKKYKIGGS